MGPVIINQANQIPNLLPVGLGHLFIMPGITKDDADEDPEDQDLKP
jgi:hypothetical protein